MIGKRLIVLGVLAGLVFASTAWAETEDPLAPFVQDGGQQTQQWGGPPDRMYRLWLDGNILSTLRPVRPLRTTARLMIWELDKPPSPTPPWVQPVGVEIWVGPNLIFVGEGGINYRTWQMIVPGFQLGPGHASQITAHIGPSRIPGITMNQALAPTGDGHAIALKLTGRGVRVPVPD